VFYSSIVIVLIKKLFFMKKRNLLFASFILSLGIGLFGCNFGNGGNVSDFPVYPVVASDYSSDFSGVIFGTYWGYCIAPAADIYPGDCTVMSFSIDYDNQPTDSKYPVASNVSMGDKIGKSFYEQSDSVRINDYKLPISDVVCVSSPYYEGKIFFGITCKDNSPNFRLVYNRQEPDSAGAKNLYLLAQPSTSSTADASKGFNYAFDIMPLIQLAGLADSTGTVTGYNCKYIKANVKYFTGFTNDSVPVYTTLNTSSTGPFVFSVFP